MNPFTILGVSSSASKDECKKAYRRLCARYHPDSATGNRDKFDEVQKAWGMINSKIPVAKPIKTRTVLSHVDLFNFMSVNFTS